ncbi:MAG: hypothetical protein AAB152_08695 [Candidatus Coatesbacteria bacterium]
MKYAAYLASAMMLTATMAGCGPKSVALNNGELRSTIDAPTQSGDFIEAMGIGAADPALPTATQRKATSRNAAIVDAQYQLVAKLKGVTIEGGITIEKAMETSSKITASVNNMVKGAEVTKIEWTNDDGCVVTVRINKKAVEQELGVRLK